MFRSWSSSTYFCQAFESLLTLVILLVAWTKPSLGATYFHAIESRIRRLSKRFFAAAISLFIGTILLRLFLLPYIPVPRPFVHDEFSYLLAAQTFAAGRVANPTPDFWPHFESVHILQVPSYMSMYPPAQGLFLAVGLRFFGFAWAGVLLSVALLSAAIFWALRAWFPAPWAFAGALLVLARWGLASYWMNTYWGGAVPAFGGALVIGSIARMMSVVRLRHAMALGLGVVILVNSRPYEGSVLILISVAVLFFSRIRGRTLTGLLKPSVLLPLGTILVLAATAMLFYNARITKEPFRLPYLEERSQYAFAPLFIWERLSPEPRYRSASLRRVYEAEAALFETTHQDYGLPEIARKTKNIWIFFFGPLLTIPLLALIFLKADRHIHRIEKAQQLFLKAVLLGALVALMQVVWFYPHYAAPSFTALVAVLLFGLKRLRAWRPKDKPAGLFLSRAIPVSCLLMTAVCCLAYAQDWRLSYWPLQWALGTHIEIHPASLETKLLGEKKKALVFVRYGPNHDVGAEWVYNSADIDASSIIWAREISPGSDEKLARYYAELGRSVWTVYPDRSPVVAEPYRFSNGLPPKH